MNTINFVTYVSFNSAEAMSRFQSMTTPIALEKAEFEPLVGNTLCVKGRTNTVGFEEYLELFGMPGIMFNRTKTETVAA